MTRIRIATRKSQLALWQAYYVAEQLKLHHPGVSVELVKMTTTGDRLLGVPLASAGGKGLFMKELETSLMNKSADIAVHSMKDVVVQLPDEFHIAAICKRDDPSDAFVSNHYDSLNQLPEGARVGTCSLRRQSQIRSAYPGLKVINLRGNVNTRLGKLDAGDFDAIILASAGLKRLDMASRIRQRIPPGISVPAVGQGAVGVECRRDDASLTELVTALDHLPSRRCVEAERAMNKKLEGGCQVPIAAFAQIGGDRLQLEGLVGSCDGKTILRTTAEGAVENPAAVGDRAADDLIARGARDVLRAVYDAN